MSDRKISQLSTVTTLNGSDLLLVQQSGTNKTITRSNLATDLGYEKRYKTVATSNYTATPSFETFDGLSYTAVSAWAASTAYSIGAFVRPSTDNGYIYECVTAGTSSASEPTWGTTIGADTTDGSVTWRCRGLNVIATTSDMTGTIKPGVPLAYDFGGTTYYGIVWSVDATHIALRGAPLLHNQSLTKLRHGLPELVRSLDLHVAGAYGDGVDDLLSSDNKQALRWAGRAAYCVHMAVRHQSADATADPRVNAKLNGLVLSRDASDAGPQVGTAWTENSPVAVNTASYLVGPGEPIELRCTSAGGTGDAADLSAQLVFVLPLTE